MSLTCFILILDIIINKDYDIKQIRLACVFLKNEAFIVDTNEDAYHVVNNSFRKLYKLCNKGVKDFTYCYSSINHEFGYQALVLLNSGKVYGWGKNAFFQISKEELPFVYKPKNRGLVFECYRIKFTPHYAFDQITCGQCHCMGLTKDNLIVIWGENTYGQLARKDNKSAKCFTLIVVNNLDTFKFNAAHRILCCCLCSEMCLTSPFSPLCCWIFQTAFLVNINQETDKFGNEGNKVKKIASGSFHSFILLNCGDLYGFGNNNRGQLGLITENNREEPTLVLKDIDQIETSGLHTLALTIDKRLFAMGDNSYYQLGNSEQYSFSVPYEISLNIVEIATINGISMAKDVDCNYYMWGLYDVKLKKLDQKKSSKETNEDVKERENTAQTSVSSSMNQDSNNPSTDKKKETTPKSKNDHNLIKSISLISEPQKVDCKSFSEIVARCSSLTHYTIKDQYFDQIIQEESKELVDSSLLVLIEDDLGSTVETVSSRLINQEKEISSLKGRIDSVEKSKATKIHIGDKIRSSLIDGLVVPGSADVSVVGSGVYGKVTQ